MTENMLFFKTINSTAKQQRGNGQTVLCELYL